MEAERSGNLWMSFDVRDMDHCPVEDSAPPSAIARWLTRIAPRFISATASAEKLR